MSGGVQIREAAGGFGFDFDTGLPKIMPSLPTNHSEEEGRSFFPLPFCKKNSLNAGHRPGCNAFLCEWLCGSEYVDSVF